LSAKALGRRLGLFPGRDNAQRSGDFSHDLASAFEFCALVRGGDDGAEAGFAFGDGGEADRGRVDTGVKKFARKFEGFFGFADVDGNDGRLAGAEFEAEFF